GRKITRQRAKGKGGSSGQWSVVSEQLRNCLSLLTDHRPLTTVLGYFNRQFAREDEVGPLAPFQILRAGLRERSDEDGERNGCIAVDISCGRAARKLAVDERLVRDRARCAPARMRCVRRNLDRVLVPARRRLDDLRGGFDLMQETAW